MFSGLKFIPRDRIEREQDENGDESRKENKKSGRKKEKDRRRKKSSRYSSSDDELEKIKKGSRKKKKWYASDEDLSSDTDESKSEGESEYEERRNRRRRKGKKEKMKHEDSSEDEDRVRSKRREDFGLDDSGSDDSSGKGRHHKGGKRRQHKDKTGEGKNKDLDDEGTQNYGGLARKEMGLEWMLRPKDATEKTPITALDDQLEETPAEEVKKVNPRELNPYLKDNGGGYPEESEGTRTRGSQLMSSTIVGDGGASWRLKALKRAQEQAARDGCELKEVVEERWGSLSQLAVSVATRKAAPTRAHLHAINNRRKGLEEEQTATENDSEKVESLRHPRMKVPKLRDSLSWGKRNHKVSAEESGLVSTALSGLNKFQSDGSFMNEFMQQRNKSTHHADSSDAKSDRREESSSTPIENKATSEDVSVGKPLLSSNQLAARVMQLRMKGKHEEADKLLKEAEALKVEQGADDDLRGPQIDGSTSRYVMHGISRQQKKKEEDADLHLAQRIMRNHQYSISGQADDEYDYDEGPRRKSQKRGGGNDRKPTERVNLVKHVTQQERCQFCFENPNRPKHLVIAIGNFAYLSLPHREPVVSGHCCILTMQHELATRSVDDNVWNEIRNFKKCLIMMFGKQEKDVVFLETVMGLAQQRRHCLVECIPLPREIAKQAPVYFKKAIDEAEDEWSQHNAKKLIDTSQKGLRGSIPKNFPYFYVEFGLDKGFVHVIDDEKEFKSSFGLNVIRGMLRLPAEDMHRRRKHESVDKQKQAVVNFARDWEPFDWTKQLDS